MSVLPSLSRSSRVGDTGYGRAETLARKRESHWWRQSPSIGKPARGGELHLECTGPAGHKPGGEASIGVTPGLPEQGRENLDGWGQEPQSRWSFFGSIETTRPSH